MLEAWRDIFVSAGYSESELQEATTWLAANAPPRRPGEHLNAIRDRIMTCRQRLAAAHGQRDEWEDRGSCVKCGGTGYLSVPHPDSVINGEWYPHPRTGAKYPTCAIACDCSTGNRIQAGLREEKHRSLTLEAYKRICPRGFMLLEKRHDELRALARAGNCDPAWDQLVSRIIDNARARSEGEIG